MSQALSALGGLFKGGGGGGSLIPGKVGAGMGDIMGILGTIRNIFGTSREDAFTKSMMDYEKRMQALASDPSAMMKLARGYQEPLSTGLKQAVGQDAQAQLQERGLTTSPQIASQIMQQSLAPYEERQQQMALQAVFQALGLPITAAGAVPQFQKSDTTAFWKQFLPKTGNSTTGISTPNYLPGLIAGPQTQDSPITGSIPYETGGGGGDPWSLGGLTGNEG